VLFFCSGWRFVHPLLKRAFQSKAGRRWRHPLPGSSPCAEDNARYYRDRMRKVGRFVKARLIGKAYKQSGVGDGVAFNERIKEF